MFKQINKERGNNEEGKKEIKKEIRKETRMNEEKGE